MSNRLLCAVGALRTSDLLWQQARSTVGTGPGALPGARVIGALAIAVLAVAGVVQAQQAVQPAAEQQPAAVQPAAEQQGPMDFFIAFSRAQLKAAGFERHEAAVAGRRTVWWQGGSGPTLVMIHGVADQAGTWFRIAPGLTERYRVLLIDLPGHGESEPAAGPLPMTTVLEGFEAWLAAHATAGESGPATLVGNSMGAWIALLAAERRPEQVARVVMTNGGPLRADTGDLDLLPADREEARRLMAALRDPSSLPTPDYMLDELVRRAPRGQVTRMFQAEEDLESYLRDAGALAAVTTPVDILWGESDRYLGREYPERLGDALPRARLTLVGQCGHLPQAECPERYLKQLSEVLATAPPGEPGPATATEDPH